MRILMTGAAGKVGTLLRPLLAREGRTLRLSDLQRVELGAGEEEVVAGPRRRGRHGDGDGGRRRRGPSGRAEPRASVGRHRQGQHRRHDVLLEAARKAGVEHLVLMGSHHAVGFHTRPPAGEELPAYAFPRPDTFYGVSKVAMEGLASLYHDRFGMNVTVIRLGTCNDGPYDTRGLATWISPATSPGWWRPR